MERGRPADREDDGEAVGRDDPGEPEERVFGDSLRSATNDQAEVGEDHPDQLHGRAEGGVLSHALRSFEGSGNQSGEGPIDGTNAARDPGEQRGARVGGYGHVERGADYASRKEKGGEV